MDDPNITMKEYIRLKEEKARKPGKVFNWETDKYGKIWYDEDIRDLRSVETKFPAIAFNDEVSSETLSCEPTVSSLNNEIEFRILFDNSDDEDYTIWLFHHVIRGTSILGLHTNEEMQTSRFDAYWYESVRQIPDKGDLRDYWLGISSARDFLGTTPSYTVIRDLILRLCHRLIACSIAGRSQEPKKVTVTDLFYLRGIDICKQLDNTWAWVAMGPERQPDDVTGAPGVAQDALVIHEGGQADPAPVQAPPPPPAAARTMQQRMAKLEDDV
ncbi:hypothetical protein Tco_1105109 [Tanacetum coccineum]